MSDAAPIRTVSAPPPRNVASIEPPTAIHAALDATMTSCTVSEAMDDARRANVRAMVRELERKLGRRFPHLHPRCVGYARADRIPVSITVEHEGELVMLQVEAPSPYPSAQADEHLLAHAIHAITQRTGIEPQED